LFGLTLVVSPSYWIGNQCIVQRALAARSEYEAKASYVWGALLKNIIPIVIVLPGILALARFPELEKTDFALPKLINRAFVPGLRGVFVAAFITALMSSVDSYINSATTLFTVDFYQRLWRPAADERQLLRVGRVVTLSMAIWGVAFATVLLQLTDSGVYSIFQTLLAFIQGPAFAVLLCGLLSRRTTATAAFIGFLSGTFTTVMLFVLSRPNLVAQLGSKPVFRNPEQSLYFSMWAFLVAVAVMFACSYGQESPAEEKLKYVLTRRERSGDL
jgi:SSS family solute:Na+ symporter